ncbi:MAG: hypothetical protein AAB393_00135 [Bacteroidota bacterium]
MTSSTSVSTQLEQAYTEDTGEKLSHNQFLKMVTEFVFLLVHVSDREAIETLGPRDSARFIVLLVADLNRLGTQLPMTDEHPVPAFVKDSSGITVVGLNIDLLNARQHEYVSYPLFAAENAPLRGTLFWEFGRHVEAVFRDCPMVRVLAQPLASGLAVNLTELLLKQFKTFLCEDPLFRDQRL